MPLERSYVEWRASVFGNGQLKPGLTCGQCHMPGREAPLLRCSTPRHGRCMTTACRGGPGALALPERAAQRQAVQRDLDTAVAAKLCVTPDGAGLVAEVTLDNAGAGHSFPSGAAHDRRAWVELSAFNAGGLVFQSGGVPEAGRG